MHVRTVLGTVLGAVMKAVLGYSHVNSHVKSNVNNNWQHYWEQYLGNVMRRAKGVVIEVSILAALYTGSSTAWKQHNEQ